MALRSAAPQGGQGSATKPPKKPNKPKTSSTVATRANKSRQQGQRGGNMFGAIGGYGGVNKDMVRRLINQTVRPDLMAMRQDRRYINRQANNAITDANDLYDRSVGDLNYVFGEAGDYINSLGQQINSGYDATAQKVAGTDGAVTGQIQQNTDAVGQAIASQLQSLGLGNAGVDPRLQQDAAFAQSQAAQQGANNQANIAMSQQSANTLSSLLGGMIAGSKASNLGQASQNRQTGINDINRARQEDMATVNDAMAQLRASKPGMIREMLLQLQAQGFDQWQAIQALNMDRRQLNHSMAMDRAGMAQQSAYYGTGAQAWGAQAGAGSSPSSSSGVSPNMSWTPNPPKPGKGRNKGRKSHSSGSQNDAIYGPLAGGYS